ncbi:MAG TPA: hypothetical protein VMH39_15735 [Gemmatimonadaceae bacterium]|nr:hypothetical protein [Gemmatimonadaceae bacterium]
MRSRLIAGVAPLLSALGPHAGAQQTLPPVHPLGPVTISAEPMGNVASIRALSDGRVLVLDVGMHCVVLFDAALRHAVVVADTTSATGNAYGTGSGGGLTGMIAFSGDSTLIRDQATGAFLVISPAGTLARIIPKPPTAPPQLNGGPFVIGELSTVGFDQAGHLVQRQQKTFTFFPGPSEFRGDTVIEAPDSTAVLRTSLATGRLDTIAMLQAPRTGIFFVRRDNGRGGASGQQKPVVNPIPSGDDWALLNDGTIAVIRVRDYHVDWISPDGHMTSGPKVAAQWEHITEAMKVALIDSLKRRDSAQAAARNAAMTPAMRDAMAKDSAARADAAMAAGLVAVATPIGQLPPRYVDPSDLPDNRPPFMTGFALGDAEGNVWVREREPAPFNGGIIYDVINRAGTLAERVEIPPSATLVGFGPGVAYLVSRVSGAVHLGKASIH